MIRILLIFPPNFAVDQPYLSLPQLMGFVRQKGVKAIQQFDANIDSFHYFMQGTFLRQCYSKITTEIKCLESHWPNLIKSDKEKYFSQCEASLYFPGVIKNIQKSLKYFNTLKNSDIQEYKFLKNVIDRAFNIISSAYYPTQISIRDFSMRFSSQSFSEIGKAIISEENPYIYYFKNHVLKRIKNGQYNLVGFSVTASSQIIPSFTLAELIRKHLQDVKIVFGGQVFNRLEKNIMETPHFFDYVDFLIVNEGETALLKLIRHLELKVSINDIPNLLYRESCTGKVKKNKIYKEDMNDLPAPDYRGFNLTKYLAPIPVLPYQPVRGCYWHKCKFCNQFLIYGKRMRCKKIGEIIIDLKYLKNKYCTCYFGLINESLSPFILKSIANELIRNDLRIKWYAGARFDNKFDLGTLQLLKKSGCEKLFFGLESGSQKILNEINKGIRLGNVRKILQDCNELGIGIHLFILIGFPTETEEDLKESKRFISELLKYVNKDNFSFYISIFQLKPETPIFDYPAKFNIKNIHRKRCYDLEYLYKFERANGSSRINYLKEGENIEEIIDNFTQNKRYPENIIHYLNFKQIFEHKRKIISLIDNEENYERGKLLLCVNPGLVFKQFKYNEIQHYNNTLEGKHSFRCLVYNIMNDDMFEIPNVHLWRILKKICMPFAISKFVNLIQEKLNIRENDTKYVRTFIKELINNKIIIKYEGD